LANEPFLIQLDENNENKLNTLIKNSGQTSKDFFTQLIGYYEPRLNKLAKVKEFEELYNQLLLVEEIFIDYIKSTRERQMDFEAKINELQASLQQSKEQFLDMQNQVEVIKQAADEKIKTTDTEANLAHEEAQRELQALRNSLALAEKTAAEAKTKLQLLNTSADVSDAYLQELEQVKQDRDQARRERNQLDAKVSELRDSLQQSEAHFSDMQKQVELIKRKADANIEAAYAEADLARKDAQRELQIMRNSLSQAEQNVAEAQAQIEWLRTLAEQPSNYRQEMQPVGQTGDQAPKKHSQANHNYNLDQEELQNVISPEDVLTEPAATILDGMQEQNQEWLDLEQYKAVQEAQRQAINEMLELQEKSKMSKVPAQGGRSIKLPWKK